MDIIPAIDIIEGKCVRLTKGDYEQKKIYNENPLEVAKEFENAGLQRLHLVDLDGAKAGEVKNWKVLEQVASKTELVIDFSGGISTRKSVSICFDSGASFAAVGSIAVKNEITFTGWLLEFGVDRFMIGADVKEEKLAIKGWTETTDLFKNVTENSYCYFVHGYYASKGEHTIATTDYVQPYSSALHKNNFYGVQFHPEKSAAAGEQILKNFMEL